MEEAKETNLSADLEAAIFSEPSAIKEIAILKKRCESYQDEEARAWNASLFRPYSQYFGFLSALKAKSILQELDQFGYLSPFEGKISHLFDYGAGTLGASLGVLDYLKEKNWKIKSLSAFDTDLGPIRWAQKRFSEFLPQEVRVVSADIPHFLDPNTLYLSVDVFNEMGLLDNGLKFYELLFSRLQNLPPSSLAIMVEPASKKINQRLIGFRDFFLSQAKRGDLNILLPCPHEKPCPALKQNEWCHEERPYRAPAPYWRIVRDLGFDRRNLTYSYLVFGRHSNQFSATQGRVVSQNLQSKGKREKWICHDGERYKVQILKRHRDLSDEHRKAFEAMRGTVLDCSSTAFKRND